MPLPVVAASATSGALLAGAPPAGVRSVAPPAVGGAVFFAVSARAVPAFAPPVSTAAFGVAAGLAGAVVFFAFGFGFADVPGVARLVDVPAAVTAGLPFAVVPGFARAVPAAFGFAVRGLEVDLEVVADFGAPASPGFGAPRSPRPSNGCERRSSCRSSRTVSAPSRSSTA